VMRVILQDFRRRIEAWQHNIVADQLCQTVWNWWMDQVFVSGVLPIPEAYTEDPAPWTEVKWVPQGWPYIHPVQDVDSAEKAIKAGFTSRSAIVSEQGEDAEVIDEEQAADNARAAEMGLAYETSTGRASAAVPATEGATA